MFKDGPIEGVVVRKLKRWSDQRGWLVETFRHDEVPAEFHPAMGYVSETKPGVARGPHEHVHQADLFAFLGPSTFRMFMWDNRPDSPTYRHRMAFDVGQDDPASVIVPVGVVHAYRNVGATDGWVLNFPNRLFMGPGKKEPVDEIRHEEQPDSPYQLDF